MKQRLFALLLAVCMVSSLLTVPAAAADTVRFSDVTDQDTAATVETLRLMGVLDGYSDGRFGPGEPITREQLAAILYRYAVYKGYDVTEKADLSGFADAAAVSTYAVDPLAWANAVGLINGTAAGTLIPRGGATRAQAATILMRWLETAAI